MKLAGLCSQAVDYAKKGIPVDIRNNLPKLFSRFRPDWKKAEVTGARELDYYLSDRALGHLFRRIELPDPNEAVEGSRRSAPLEDPITRAVTPLIRNVLKTTHDNDDGYESDGDEGYAEQVHAHYVREMRFICMTHTLVDSPDVCLKEEEVVLGTILANCMRERWRSDRTYRMKLHAEELVSDIYTQIVQCEGRPTEEQCRAALPHAWAAWRWAQHNEDREYIESFALLVLRIVFDCLKRLGALPDA
jgi:RNA-dependent RNA polymerase